MVDLPQGNVKVSTLNATQGSLLGMLADGPKTGWELLQEARAGLARFWNVTQSHVYRELAALEKRKLVKAGPPGPRDRRPLSITAAGRREFGKWLAEPPGDEQIRFPLLVTLWFGRHLDDATLATFVAKTRAEHEQRLAQYDEIRTADVHAGAVVSFGLHYERAVLEWLDSLPFQDPARMGFILIDKPRPDIAVVTMNRPERMNAMAFDVMIPLRDALETLSHDNDVRVVVLTGAGHGFCSGADLEDAGIVPNIDGLTVTSIARRALELLDDVILAVRKMHQPVIGAINGAAIGGGFCLACACDLRIASDAAYFRAAGINNGLTASELGISYLLPREIGSARAFDIMLTGRDVDAAEAERIGLVSRVVPGERLLDECYAMAERMIGFSRVGVEVTKRMLWSSLDAGSLAAHMDHEGIAQLYVRLTTKNFEEAIRARKEKRPPEYKD